MTNEDIALRRLLNQQLARPRYETPGELFEWLGAIQGQDYAGAKWSLGLRLPGSTDAAIGNPSWDKTIVRTWALRGTLHLVAARDIRWLLNLLAPRLIAGNARRYRELELDEPTLARSTVVLVDALRKGKALNRSALRAILERHGISTQGQRAVYMLQRASLQGLICQGVTRRNDPTYILLEEALPVTEPLERDAALGELARRYFSSRGPATLQDFVWWSGLATADAQAGLESVQSQFVHETIGNQVYWFSQSRVKLATTLPTVYLLPGFDEYTLAYKDRRASLNAAVAKKMTPANGMLSPTIVIDGQVVGTWSRTFDKGTVVIACNPFVPLSAARRRALAAAAERYARFLGMPSVLK